MVRRHALELFDTAQRDGITQKMIAARGGLTGQNLLSRLLTNRKLGPSVDTFLKAISGLGKPLSVFFAEVEAQERTERAAAISQSRAALHSPDGSRERAHRHVVPEVSVEDLAALVALEQAIRQLGGAARVEALVARLDRVAPLIEASREVDRRPVPSRRNLDRRRSARKAG
jgi:transcriptional regulator with XRE-family HTH domain